MQGMTITPPEKPYTKRQGTRNVTRADGEWKRDHAYPEIVTGKGTIVYGVVVDDQGQAWGRYVRKGARSGNS